MTGFVLASGKCTHKERLLQKAILASSRAAHAVIPQCDGFLHAT